MKEGELRLVSELIKNSARASPMVNTAAKHLKECAHCFGAKRRILKRIYNDIDSRIALKRSVPSVESQG